MNLWMVAICKSLQYHCSHREANPGPPAFRSAMLTTPLSFPHFPRFSALCLPNHICAGTWSIGPNSALCFLDRILHRESAFWLKELLERYSFLSLMAKPLMPQFPSVFAAVSSTAPRWCTILLIAAVDDGVSCIYQLDDVFNWPWSPIY